MIYIIHSDIVILLINEMTNFENILEKGVLFEILRFQMAVV